MTGTYQYLVFYNFPHIFKIFLRIIQYDDIS